MVIAVCLDNSGGMAFGNRRQSRDIAVYKDLIQLCKAKTLYISEYSRQLFEELDDDLANINVVPSFDDALALPNNACVFTELEQPSKITAVFGYNVSKVVLYKWNRDYPSDLQFDLDISSWKLHSRTEFPGKSHEKITREVFTCE